MFSCSGRSFCKMSKMLVRFCLTVVFAFSLLIATGSAQLLHECLDQVATGERCCTPSAFIKLSFNLRLNSVAGGCDSPSYLDQGVRLEVRRPGGVWKPVRFYTSTKNISSDSLVTVVSDTHVLDENNSQFPLYENQSSQPFTITEYLCGNEYYTPDTEYRWLQHFNGTTLQDKETWSLSDVSIKYFESGLQCSSQLTESAFLNSDGSLLNSARWTMPACEQESQRPLSVYFNEASVVNGLTQRSVVIRPQWWNAVCLPRMEAGCVLSDGCAVSNIGAHMCSLGDKLQCQCRYPQLTGDENVCIDGIVGFNRQLYDFGEKETAKICVVLLQGRLTEDVNLLFETYSGTAIDESDFQYVSPAGSLTLSPTTTQRCVDIEILEDSELEDTEFLTVSLSLTSEQNSVSLSPQYANVSIIDKNGVDVSVIPSSSIKEGTASVLSLKTGDYYVNISAVSSTAELGVDFNFTNRTFDPKGSEIMAIRANIDKEWEDLEENITLNIIYYQDTDSVEHHLFRTVYFVDEDGKYMTVGFNDSNYTVSEGDGSVNVCVHVTLQQERSIADGAELNLAFITQSGTAQEILDYQGISDILKFSSSVSEQCVSVDIIENSVLEDTESLTVALSLLTGGDSNIQLKPSSAKIFIADNDVVEVGFVQSEYTVSELNRSVIVCAAVKQGILGVPIPMSIISHSLTALEKSDYDRLSNNVTLSDTTTEQCVSLDIVDDSVLEDIESLTVSLSLPVKQDSVSLSPPTATVFITDDDTVEIGFVQSEYTVSEFNQSVMLCVEVKRGSLGVPISLSLATHDKTAQERSDYDRLSNSVTLSDTTTQQCVSLDIVDDSVLEDIESLTVSLSLNGEQNGVSLSAHTATIFINDDDAVEVGFMQSEYTVSEFNQSVMVCIEVKQGSLGIPISLSLATHDITALERSDYDILSNNVTLSDTTTQQCVSLDIVDDSVLEDIESLTVSLSLIQKKSRASLSPHTIIIFINDDDAVEIGFVQSEYTVSEFNLSVMVCVEVKRGSLGVPVYLSLTTHDMTAREKSDYDKLSNNVTLSDTNTQQCVLVDIVDDSVLEDIESLTVSLSLNGEQNSVSLSPHTATIFINDDDAVEVGFVQSEYTVSEFNQSVMVCVELKRGSLGVPISLSLTTHDITAQERSDYDRLSNDVTLSHTTTQQCVSLDILDDSVLEDIESLTVSLSLNGEQNSVSLSPHTATIFINDDDAVEIGFVQSEYTVSEFNQSVMVCVELKRGSLGVPISLSLATRDVTAQERSDYDRPSNNLTLSPTTTQQCVSLDIVDDSVLEDIESLTVSLSLNGEQNSVSLSPHTATIFINDDDAVEIGFIQSEYTVSEFNQSVMVCVEVKQGSLGVPIHLSLTTHDITAREKSDYDKLSNNVTLSPTTTQQCVSLDIVDDSVLEDIESLTVSLSLNGEQNSVSLSPHTATIFINDDDAVEIGFMQSEYTVSEFNQSVIVCVELKRGSLSVPIHFLLTTHDVTARGRSDYDRQSNNATLSDTTTQQCVSLDIVDDSVLEDIESLTVSLSLNGEQNSVSLSPHTATIFINDDDAVEIGFVQSEYTVSEFNQSVMVCIELKQGSLGVPIHFLLTTHDITAQERSDYDSLSNNVTLSDTTIQQCVLVDIVDDLVLEEIESLTVSLSLNGEQNSVSLSPHTATIFINDDDAVEIGFVQSEYTVSEFNQFVMVCVEVKRGSLGVPISLSLATHDVTAQERSDYDRISNNVTLSDTTTQQCVSLDIVDDSVLEDIESLTVSLSLPVKQDSVSLSPPTATIFITDDDTVEIGFVQSEYTVSEFNQSVMVCVEVKQGSLGIPIHLLLSTDGVTARGDRDFEVMSNINMTLSPFKTLESCVSVVIVDDDVVELSENLTVALSQTGKMDKLKLKYATVVITDDDVAEVGLEQRRFILDGVEDDERVVVRTVEVCIVTNSTLERSFNLSLVVNRSAALNRSGLAEKPVTLQLQPGDSRVCANLNVSTKEERLSFSVQSDEVTDIIITSPNGTIIVEPSLSGVTNLLNGGEVNIGEVVDVLEGIVNELIESGQTASVNFTETFLGVVSDLLAITSNQNLTPTQKNGNGDKNPGTSLLITLDKFALRSFDASLGVITDNNIKLHVIDGAEQSASDETKEGLTGIIGSKNESINIPAEILQDINSTVTVASYYLTNVSGLLPNTLQGVGGSELVSSVLSSALGCGDVPCNPVVNATEPVRISLKHRKVQVESEKATCVYYNLNISKWSDSGCNINETESTDDSTVCYCNHLTHFAVMLSPKDSVDKQNAYRLRLIGYVGVSISLVCLFLTVFIFCYFKALWSMRNYIHINLCINLFISQFIFMVGVDKTSNQNVCRSIAVVLHYSFLVTFMWMLMEGVVLYVALVKVFVTKPRRYIISFTVISYGAPLLYMALVVPLGFLLSDNPHYGGDVCWLKSSTHFVWAFAAPVILIILANIGFFMMAILIIWKQQRRKKLSGSQIQKAKHWLKVSVSLLVVMGISWIIGVLTFHEALLFVSYIFTIVVAFQGALIFILFVVLSKQVRLTLKKWLIRNVISKSEYLSVHFSEFTRSTKTGYSQSSHSSNSHLEKSSIAQGIKLGTFLALPEKQSEIDQDTKISVSPSPPPSVTASLPSPQPSTPSPPPSPVPESPDTFNENTGNYNTFTVVLVTSDKDSGQGSADTDSTLPPMNLQQPTLTDQDEPSITTSGD